MAEARALVFPQAITLGARPLTVPGGGNVLVASALFPFRLSDRSPVPPATWYETVSTHAGPDAVPDTMAPLPGAELLVLGTVPPVTQGDVRPAHLRCGSLSRDLVFRADPERPDAPFVPDARAAAWHEEDNPGGRGGPDDERPALIVRDRDREQPIWLGHTPFDHPARLKLVGTPDVASGTGWPPDADPSVLYEAHPAFWSERFQPDDPVAFQGLAATALDGRLPPYRITITSGRDEGRFYVETSRIHAVTIIPSADLGAVIWRAAIPVGDDILGEKVQALVAALEDADSEPKDFEHWGRIAVERWLDPSKAADDRPLLPAALAATVVLPFSMVEDDPIKARHAAAEEWMKDEVGVGEANPFGELAPEEAGLAEQAIDATGKEDEPPDPNEIDDIAKAALAASKERHAEAGFKERSPEEQNAPRTRGDHLNDEIEQRLAAPYQSSRDRNIVEAIRDHEVEGMDPDEVMEKLANARHINPDPPPVWPAFDEHEAPRFGDAVYERLAHADLDRHVDVAGAALVGPTEDGRERRRIVGRRFDGVFAEDTRWEGTEFLRCEFVDASFARAAFHACEFRDCTFRNTNLSKAEVVECTLLDCAFTELRIIEPTWRESRFERCEFDDVQLSDAAMSDTTFSAGSWRALQIAGGLLMDMAYLDMSMEEVTLSDVMMPQCRFERIAMTKVWMMGQGPAGSTFDDVEGDTCGFLGNVRFDRSTFNNVRFSMTGFTGAVFQETAFSPECRFDRCDFSNAFFIKAEMAGIRFIECSMTGSNWMDVTAPNAWFYGCLLRGVDFGDAELANVVFADADLEGTRFLPDKTINADFRGTVRADPGQS